MSQVNADIEAIRHLRQELYAYTVRQLDALTAAEHAVDETLQLLYEQAAYWRREQGRQPDAAVRLEAILVVQRRVEEASLAHRHAAQRLEALLTQETPRGLTFLDGRICALEAYYAVGTAQTTSAVAPIAAAMRLRTELVIDAIGTRGSALQNALGAAGEQLVAQVTSQKFGLVELGEQGQEKRNATELTPGFAAPGIGLVLVEMEEQSDHNDAPNDELMQKLDSFASQDSAGDTASVVVFVAPEQKKATVYARKGRNSWQLIAPEETANG